MNKKYFGLTSSDVEKRKKEFGENILREKKQTPAIFFFLNQFKSPLIYVLLIAGIFSAYYKEYENAILILAVIIVNSILGFYQEYSAQKTLGALKKLIKPLASVIRDGKRIQIDAKDLVPGDIVVLAAGDQIPADGKTIEATNLLVNEAILTGEQEAIDKKPDKDALLFMGTTVLAGVGIMEIEKIGFKAEIGKISTGLSEIKEESTPLEKKLKDLSKDLVILIAITSLIIFIFGIIKNNDLWATIEFSIILAVATIPEGLPVAATVILSLGMKRILKKKGLTKKLSSVETLGSTSVICTDKTGTITEGKMQVVKTNLSHDEHAFMSLILANQQKDTLEICLWQYVEKKSKIHPSKVLESVKKIYEEPFNSNRKYSMTIVNDGKNELGYMLGAPEIVMNFCLTDKKEKEKIREEIENWASSGLKIVGAAYKESGDLKAKSNWKWLGIVGVEDPVRPEVADTVRKCQEAGIKIKIVTGDYKQTAIKIASLIGLPYASNNIMEADELNKISVKELRKKIDDITVFSRVTPEQKLKIIEALQQNGEVVAMTGDGVNDTLALKKANIAVVVNDAADLAKEVSDLILLDSNFKTIYTACEEGRIILANIKKVVGFVLSNSFIGVIVVFLAVLLNLPAPLTVLMILWINLICDGPIDIMLGFEEKEDGIMKISPALLQKEKILDKFIIRTALAISLFVGLSAIAAFYFILNKTSDLPIARTVVFSIISTAGLIYVFSFKNLHLSILKNKHLANNKLLLASIVYGVILVLAVIYIPALNKIFETKPIGASYWIMVVVVGLISILIAEISKQRYIKKRIITRS